MKQWYLMITNLDDLLLFVTLVETGTFTAGAHKLKMPKSTLSRRLSQLEAKLGSELLIRTTRNQTLTESGRLLYCACKNHIDALSKVEEQVGALINQPQGQLNILLPLEFFNKVISTLIVDFVQLYPKIMLNCQHYSAAMPEFDHHHDLCFVLHEQELPPSNWIGKELLSFPQSIYASSDFDTSNINTPEDLSQYPCILSEDSQPWFFRDANTVQAVYGENRIILSSPEMRLQATQKNLGLCKLADYVLQFSSQENWLQRLSLTKAPIAQRLSVLYQSRNIAVKTRIFLDFFQSNIGNLL